MTPERVERDERYGNTRVAKIRAAYNDLRAAINAGDLEAAEVALGRYEQWSDYVLDARHAAKDARIRELEEAQRLAHIRIGICADRMEGCNAIGGDHQLIDEVREWESDARAVLQGEK